VGSADRNTVLGDSGEDFAKGIVDVGSGQEVTGDGDGECGADFLRFHELPLLLGMEDAERRVSGGAREAATAAVGGFKRAAIGVRSFARRSFL